MGLTPDDFIQRGAFFRMGRPPLMIEIFPEIKGIDFGSAWEKRIETTVDPNTGLKAFLISHDDLMTAKLATARPRGLADVEAIRKAVAGTPGSSKRDPGAEK